MSEKTPVPTLEVLDAEPVGSCLPDSEYCEAPGPQPELTASVQVRAASG